LELKDKSDSVAKYYLEEGNWGLNEAAKVQFKNKNKIIFRYIKTKFVGKRSMKRTLTIMFT